MKLLVLAQTPPPVHGQSVMVAVAVQGLPADGIELEHVEFRLSRNSADIGRWHPGKLLRTLDACFHAVVTRFTAGCDTLYYVPAPAKRGALYRDWMVMLLCRPFFRRLVLHWHAAGLGEWLQTSATAPERWLTKLLLGRANLALVLGENLRADAQALAARKIAVVRNGIADPCPGFTQAGRSPGSTRTAVFVGLGVPDKGVRDAIEAIRLANQDSSAARWRLVIAGAIPDPGFAAEIAALVRLSEGQVEYAGFVSPDAKHRLLAAADALLFPTYYAAETQGLVVAEALAYDLPVVVTHWRAVAENLPPGYTHIVAPRAPHEIARALANIARTAPPHGKCRQHFLDHYTLEEHLLALAAELRAL